MQDERHMVGLSDAGLAAVDPLELNLAVAKGVPSLAHLGVTHYRLQADAWAGAIKSRLPGWERAFHKAPQDWGGNLHLFRLGMLCGFAHHELGIRYKEDEKDAASVAYTDPADLFLCGVMDTRQGDVRQHGRPARGPGLAAGLAGVPGPGGLALRPALRRRRPALQRGGDEHRGRLPVARRRLLPPGVQCPPGARRLRLRPGEAVAAAPAPPHRRLQDPPLVRRGGPALAARDFPIALPLYSHRRLYRHLLSQCGYLPPDNRRYLTVAR